MVKSDSAGPVALHTTADGGTTWRRTDFPAMSAAPARLPVGNPAFAADGRAVVPVFLAGSGFRASLYTSTDGGRTWLGPLPPPLPIAVGYGTPADLGVTAAGGGWWSVNGDRLALSRDGGRTWAQHRIGLPRGYRAVSADFTDPRTGLVVATDSRPFQTPPPAGATPPPSHEIVLRTDDGGAHWHQVTIPSRSSGTQPWAPCPTAAWQSAPLTRRPAAAGGEG